MSGRAAVEAGLRVVVFVALGALVWYAFRAPRPASQVMATGVDVDSTLVRWTTREAPGRAHVELDAPPSPEVRDWLGALGRAGTAVSWGGAAPPPSGLAVEPVADPRRPSRVWLAAPTGSRILLRDELGALDSVTVERGGATVRVPHLHGTVHAAATDIEATSAQHDSLVLRPILLLGQASWEAKFTLAALEEHGWEVDARLAVAPSGDARQGAVRVTIDTARYAAVVAIDSVAARYRTQIARYVQTGGGLIAIGEAAGLAALEPLFPASLMGTPSLPGVFTGELARASPRRALGLAPLGRLEPKAVALETRGGAAGQDEDTAVVAWRVGDGRVLQVGYHDTWRWRMAGAGEDPVREHRDWWAALVSGAAYSPRVRLRVDERLEPTPLASLVATLGPATSPPSAPPSPLDDPRIIPFLFGLAVSALLLEWLSRRSRGRA